MKNKKAQGLSINVIIVATIAIIVMIILILVFTGRIKGFNAAANECQSVGGTCKEAGVTECTEGQVRTSHHCLDTDGKKDTRICCYSDIS